jgi:hypothetical protein
MLYVPAFHVGFPAVEARKPMLRLPLTSTFLHPHPSTWNRGLVES